MFCQLSNRFGNWIALCLFWDYQISLILRVLILKKIISPFYANQKREHNVYFRNQNIQRSSKQNKNWFGIMTFTLLTILTILNIQIYTYNNDHIKIRKKSFFHIFLMLIKDFGWPHYSLKLLSSRHLIDTLLESTYTVFAA